MSKHIITLPTGEAIAASAIIAVRKFDAQPSIHVCYGAHNTQITATVQCETVEERDTLAASIIEQWQASLAA